MVLLEGIYSASFEICAAAFTLAYISRLLTEDFFPNFFMGSRSELPIAVHSLRKSSLGDQVLTPRAR